MAHVAGPGFFRVSTAILFQGTADNFLGSEADRKRQRQDNSAEEDAEGQFDNSSPDSEMVQHHGYGQHKHQPFNALAEQSSVLQIHVHGADENASCQEARDHRARQQEQNRAYDTR